MTDIFLETLNAVIVGIILWMFVFNLRVKNKSNSDAAGNYILIGFTLMLFGLLIDITDNFPQLNHLVVIGDTPAQAFLEKFIGVLLGLFFLFIGFKRWLPNVSKLKELNWELKREIELRKLTEEKLMQLALYDPLTGLPNRNLVFERLPEILTESKSNDQSAAVLFIDFNDFKSINDTFGHSVGDSLLKSVAERLQHSVRKVDLVGRLGGDEFVIVLADVKNHQEVRALLNELVCELNIPFMINDNEIYQHVSIGVAIYPYDGVTQKDLLSHADAAMYESKKMDESSYTFYSSSYSSNSLRIA
ncbi:hypothetical protein GCM10009133_21380 [Cocleimonas flava]|uniref:Diguanylate cyclase (GGDEF)-like protein n=1 Tax=Cocleimonas flava TaxID=634765 RepID=A0A4R1ESE1_9GAMM|nr:GGDEF domain-containing protein [Cocleimonas flava]TCJ82674.1 diguanylate cyclase (GGDEF)-like protein [Cocleimonas flava]